MIQIPRYVTQTLWKRVTTLNEIHACKMKEYYFLQASCVKLCAIPYDRSQNLTTTKIMGKQHSKANKGAIYKSAMQKMASY